MKIRGTACAGRLKTAAGRKHRFSTAQTFHYARHLQGRLGRFRAAIVFFIQAAFPCLLLVFQEEDFMDDGNFVLNLDLCQSVAHGLADVLRMGGRAAQNHAETDDG